MKFLGYVKEKKFIYILILDLNKNILILYHKKQKVKNKYYYLKYYYYEKKQFNVKKSIKSNFS